MESTFEFDPEVLDNLYKHQLQQLKDITHTLDDTQDINLCRKWLQVLNKSSEDEKVPRNCLCVLLYQQLKNDGHLSMPFTDLSNCNRDLAQVLASLDKNLSRSSIVSLTSDVVPWIPNEKFQLQENEIERLKQELSDIRQEISQKEAKIHELNMIIEKCNQCKMEQDVINQICQILDNFQNEPILKNLFIFTQLFAEDNNLDLQKKLKDLDRKLQETLQNIQTTQILITQKRLVKAIKSNEKNLRKCEQKMSQQKLQHKIKTKFVKLQFCSILSQIFLKSREKSQTQFLEMLDSLENKYKDIILRHSLDLPYDLTSWRQ